MSTLTLLTVLFSFLGVTVGGRRQVTEVMRRCRSDEAAEVTATFLIACLCDGNYMHEEAWSDRMCLVMTTHHLSDDGKKKKTLLFKTI